jgi:heterodisulfide reductase subunit B
MKYAYYPGCSLHSTATEYEQSAHAMCKALGIELEEIPGWICCGASSGHMTSELMALALPVKNLVLAREMEMDTVVTCAACYSRLKVANHEMCAPEDRRVPLVDEVVGSRYRGESAVQHLVEVVIKDLGLEALQARVRKPLSGLKVAAYYGCLLLRPPEVMQFDDPEEPTSLESLIAALGAEPVDWPYKTECCGGSLALTRTNVVLKLCRDILQMAADAGADCVMVACPLCQSSLDLRQPQVNKHYGTDLDLPVLYFTQLAGLALGLAPRALGLRKLVVSPNRLLKAKALI